MTQHPPKKYPLWRYALAVSLVISLIAGLDWLSLNVMPEAEEEAQFIRNNLHQLEHHEVQAINLGASIAKSLDFSILGISGVNLAYNGRDILENEALIDIVLKKNSNLKQVFWGIEPIGLLMENAQADPYSRRIYYRILAKYRGWYPIGNDWSNLVQGGLLPLVRKDHWKKPIVAAIAWFTEQKSNETGLMAFIDKPPLIRPETNFAQNSVVETNMLRGLLSKTWQDEYYHEHRTLKYTMQSIIRVCKTVAEQGLDLIIYVPPVTDVYRQETSKFNERIAPYWPQVTDACTKSGATLLRWDEDEKLLTAYELFKDTFHLNQKGSILFSKEMKSRLEELKINH